MTYVRRSTLVLLAIALPFSLWAVDVQTSRRAAEESRTVEDDYLFAGRSLSLTGSVDSLYFTGRDLDVDGTVGQNLIAAARSLSVDGEVSGESVLAAQSVEVSGSLSDTAFVAAESVDIAQNGQVIGALFVAGNTVVLDGAVDGDLYVAARRLTVRGTISGDVHAAAADVRLEPGARIEGNFTYDAEAPLSQAEIGVVGGEVTEREWGRERGWRPWVAPLARWITNAILLLSVLAFSLLLHLFPGMRQMDADRDSRRFWVTVAWGLIPFFLYPVLIGALFFAGFAFGITIPIAVSLMLGAGALAFLLSAYALPQIGGYIARLFSWNLSEGRGGAVILKTLLGFVPVLIIGLVPYVQSLVGIVVLALGWGVLLEKLLGRSLSDRRVS